MSATKCIRCDENLADYDNGEPVRFECGVSVDGPFCVDCADEIIYLHENEESDGSHGPDSGTGCVVCRQIRQEDIAIDMAEDRSFWE